MSDGEEEGVERDGDESRGVESSQVEAVDCLVSRRRLDFVFDASKKKRSGGRVGLDGG